MKWKVAAGTFACLLIMNPIALYANNTVTSTASVRVMNSAPTMETRSSMSFTATDINTDFRNSIDSEGRPTLESKTPSIMSLTGSEPHAIIQVTVDTVLPVYDNNGRIKEFIPLAYDPEAEVNLKVALASGAKYDRYMTNNIGNVDFGVSGVIILKDGASMDKGGALSYSVAVHY